MDYADEGAVSVPEERPDVSSQPPVSSLPPHTFRQRVAAHSTLAKVTATSLVVGLLAYVLWRWMGPEGSTTLQWAPVPATLLVLLSGAACGLGILLAAILTSMCIPFAHPFATIVKNMGLGVLVVASGCVIALSVLIGVLLSEGSFAPRQVLGGSYYEINHGFPDPYYMYYESHGVLLMARTGQSTGEQRAESTSDGAVEPTTGPSHTAPQAAAPGQSAAPNETNPEDDSTDTPINSEQIVASGSSDGWMFGVATRGSSLASQGGYTAAASSDGGTTWERRGQLPADGSMYRYRVLTSSVQLLAYGTSSDEVAPLAFITRDGGWTWSQLSLPIPADTPAGAQFVENALVDGEDLTVTINYPDWVSARGAGTSFVSSDDGATWALVLP